MYDRLKTQMKVILITAIGLGFLLPAFAGGPRTWIGPIVGGNWNDPMNWNPNDVPDSATEIALINNGTSMVQTIILDISVTIDSLVVENMTGSTVLNLNGQNLSVLNALDNTLIDGGGRIEITGGSEFNTTGTSVVQNTGEFMVMDGTLSGSGTVNVTPSGVFSFSTAGPKSLTNCTLSVDGQLNWLGGDIAVTDAMININAAGAFAIDSLNAMNGIGSSGLNVDGTLERNNPAGIATLNLPVFLSGTVTLIDGDLNLTSANDFVDGTFDLQAIDSDLFFTGNASFDNVALQGNGTYHFDFGTYDFVGADTQLDVGASAVSNMDAIFQGNFNLNNAGTMVVDDSALFGDFHLVNQAGGQLSLNNVELNGNTQILNQAMATVNWTMGDLILNDNASLVNLGIVNVMSLGNVTSNGGGTAQIDNSGDFNKTSPGVMTVNVPFLNNDNLNVSSGATFTALDDMTNAGQMTIIDPGVFNLAGGNFTQTNMGIFTGDGIARFSGGTAMIDGTYTLGGMNFILGTDVTFQMGGPLTLDQLLINGGSLSISQVINIVSNLTWQAGPIQGSGTIVTNPTSVLTMDSPGIKELLFDARMITQGPANYTDGSFVIDQGGVLEIQQHFRIQGDLPIQEGMGGSSLIENAGIFEKDTGPGAALIEVIMTSSGDIRSSSGELSFVNPVMHDSGKVEVMNASINFQGGLTVATGDVEGEGTILGDVTVNAGFVKPGLLGNGIGALNFSNNLVLANTATTVFQIESGGALGSFDSLAVIGTAMLGGTAQVLYEPAYMPMLGDVFPLINAGTLNGTFDNVQVPPGINGLMAQDSIVGNTFQVEIVAGAAPTNPQVLFTRRTPEEAAFADPNTAMLNTAFNNVGDTTSFATSSDGEKVIVTEFGNDRIKIIDATTNLIDLELMGFTAPLGAAFLAGDQFAWVLNDPNISRDANPGPMGSFVQVVDVNAGMIIGTLTNPCIDNAFVIASNPVLNQFYLLNSAGELCIFDETATLINTLTLPFIDGNKMVVTDDGAFVLISGSISNQVVRVQVSDFDTTVLALPGSPRGLDYDQLTGTLYLAGDGDNVYRVNVADMTLATTYNMVGAGNLQSVTVLPNLDAGFAYDLTNDQIFRFLLSNGTFTIAATGIGNVTNLANNDVVMLDQGELRLSMAAYQVVESDGPVMVGIERVNGLSGTLSAMLSSSNGSATGGEDFAIVNEDIVFAPGEAGPQMVAIDILDDALSEGNESFLINLISKDGATQIVAPMEAEVTILDDDAATPSIFSLTNTVQTVSEGSGQVLIEVQRAGGNLGEVTLGLNVTPVDATLNFDYLNPGTLVFPAGDPGPRTLAIPILNDEVAELSESFDVALQIVNGAGIIGLPATANITINDDDPVTISWSSASITVNEADAGKRAVSVVAQVETNRIADYPVFFSYQVGGTATPGLDHDLMDGSGLIPIGRRSAFFNFQVLPDDLFEEDETVTLQLLANGATPVEPSILTLTILDDERLDPTPRVSIISPAPGSVWSGDAPIPFLAEVLLNGEASINWEICSSSGACMRKVGNDFQEMLPPGIYEAICIAQNADTGETSTPARTQFEVVEGEPTARISIISPARSKINLPEGKNQSFSVEVTPQNGPRPSIEWLLEEDGPVVGTGFTFSPTFPESGRFTVIARVAGASGPNTSDWREVEVASEDRRRPDVQILSPANRTIVAPGEAILFQGRVNDLPDGVEVPLTWNFGNGTIEMGNEVANISFAEPGRYQVRLSGRLNDRRASDEITIFVQDPNRPPSVGIFPVTDLQIYPYDENIPNSGEVFFRPLIREARGFQDFVYSWDFGNGQTSNASVPGKIRYTEEGTYQVTLQATAANGLTSPVAKRTIIVKRTTNTSFEPNNDFAEAATLLAGQYPDLAVDDDGMDFYQIEIGQQSQSLVVRFFENEPALVEIFDENRSLVRTETVEASGNLQVVGLNPGVYFLKVSAAPGAKRLGIGYGISLDVLNPSLYFATVESSAVTGTELGMVNLSNNSSSIEVLGFDAKGNLLDMVPLTLGGNGRINLRMDDLFEDTHRSVKWVEVDSTADLVGYARTMSRDGEELYATTASKKRSSDLFVPHIAENLDQWFTRAAVVNVDDNPGEGVVITPNTETSLAINEPFAQDSFDFVERFGGTLPENGIWARLSETDSKVNMVGVEIFGTKDGTRQIAGLELLDYQTDNPNFLYVANSLFFTHIASDVDNFYTGIALVNVGDLPQNANIFAYAEDGTRVGPKTVTLRPNEKLVSLADSLLEGIGSTQETAWIQVEADNEIAGFEVFGTRDGKRLAGLEATNALSTSLCYPYIDADGETFHGVSLINPNAASNAMTLSLYDDLGNLLGTRQLSLAPGEKLVTLMADLFPEAFSNQDGMPTPGWLSLEASLPTAGFELFTGKETDQMGAILAQ